MGRAGRIGIRVPLRAKELLIRWGELRHKVADVPDHGNGSPSFALGMPLVSSADTIGYGKPRAHALQPGPSDPVNATPGRRATWQKKTADSRRWIEQSSAKLRAKVERQRS